MSHTQRLNQVCVYVRECARDKDRERERSIRTQREPSRAVAQTEPEQGRRNRGQVLCRQSWERRSVLMVTRMRVSVLGTSGP